MVHKTPEIIYTNNGHFVFSIHNLCKNKHLITVLTASLHAERAHELAYAQHYDNHYCCTSPACTLCAWQLLKFGISVNSIYYYIIPYSTMLLLIVHNQSSFCVSYPNSWAWRHCQRHCHCIILRNIIWSSQGYKIS